MNLSLDEECEVFLDVSNTVGFNDTAELKVITIPPVSPGENILLKTFRASCFFFGLQCKEIDRTTPKS